MYLLCLVLAPFLSFLIHDFKFAKFHRNFLHFPLFEFSMINLFSLSLFSFRIISHESTVNVRKGRQTLCNLHRPNDLYSVEQASGRTPLTINTSTAPIALNRLLLKGHQKDRTQLFASFQSIVCNAKASPIKPNLFQSIASCWPEYRAQTSYFCHPLPPPPPASHCCCRRRRRRACTTNQQQQKSHVGIRTVTTKTAPPNCNYNRQQRKTYSDNIDTDGNNKNNQNHSSSNDDNRDCIKSSSNTIDTNKTGWYIHLASNCYRNGFQLHVNHLDEWSKHPCLVQRKPIQVLSFLRLPSSALQPTTSAVSGKKTVRVSYDNYQPSDTACDFVGDSSIVTSQPIRVSCEQINLNGNKINDCIEKSPSRLAHQLKSDDIKRIYVKNSLKPSDTHQHLNRSIDDSSKLPIIDTERIAGEQEEQQQQQVQRHNDNIKQQFDTPNAKNTMNSSRIAIDANIHLPPTTNRQLSCQAIQNNYHNNNLTFDREFHAGAEQSVPPTHTLVNAASVTATDATTIADNAATIFNNTNNVNNNQHQQHHHHWLNENNSNAIVSTTNPQSIGTRPPTAPNHIDDIVIDDLIESFHTKFDVIDPTQRRKLPQITLSDFSNNQLSLTSSASPSPSALLSASLPASTAAAAAATPLAFAIQSTHTLSEHPDQLQHFFYQTANTQ